jgi:small subunit ribosomal protein S6
MKKYELPLVLKTSGDIEPVKENVKAILQKHGAQIEAEDAWGTRKLAYEIDNEREGYYLILTLEVTPAQQRHFAVPLH